MNSKSTKSSRTQKPHFKQAKRWYRFARRLRDAKGVYGIKERGLKWSLKKGTNGFAIPALLETAPKYERGYQKLMERTDSFPEVELKTVLEESPVSRMKPPVERVEVFAHFRTAKGVEKVAVGRLEKDHAEWVKPLLKENLTLKTFVAHFEASPGQTAPYKRHEVGICIKRPDVAGKAWSDIIDARKAKAQDTRETYGRASVPAYIDNGATSYTGRDYNKKIKEVRAEISRLQVKANELEAKRISCAHIGREIASLKGKVKSLQQKAARGSMRRTDEPSVEEWLRSSSAVTCATDLPASDFWQVQHQAGF